MGESAFDNEYLLNYRTLRLTILESNTIDRCASVFGVPAPSMD